MKYQQIQNTMYMLIVSSVVCFCAMAFVAAKALSSESQLGPGSHKMALTVDGMPRTYIVHVPSSYDLSTRTPVVIMLHGGGGTAKAAMWETGWTEKADTAGFLAVFPNAMARDPSRRSNFARNPQLWNDGSDRFYPGQTAVDDARFISVLLDDLETRFSVD